jgi:hypothetical protein
MATIFVPLVRSLAPPDCKRKFDEPVLGVFYKAPGVPLAVMGFISPIFCAAAMECSDLIVISNALRLLRWRI